MDAKEFSNLLDLDLDSCIEEVDAIDASKIDKMNIDNCHLRISLLKEHIEKLEGYFESIKNFIEYKDLYDNEEKYIRDLEKRIIYTYDFIMKQHGINKITFKEDA